jgi:centromeric protein E
VEASYQNQPFGADDDDETMGEFGDGTASLQMQVSALQADLADKNRYISTLERRLLQARRSSHSRVSMGLSQIKSGDESDIAVLLREKDTEIAELRNLLDDKDRMLTALRSAARQRDLAQMTGDSQPEKRAASRLQIAADVSSSSEEMLSENPAAIQELVSTNPNSEKQGQRKTKGVEDMSRILDEMIEDRVDNDQLIKSARGSVRLANKHESAIFAGPPPLSGTLIAERPATADPLLRV